PIVRSETKRPARSPRILAGWFIEQRYFPFILPSRGARPSLLRAAAPFRCPRAPGEFSMSMRMLSDARHPEESRVAVVKGNRIEECDFESAEHKQLKGNIYLAKVTRVEPSLQAAFVDYGGNRHGFLAFSEIHPDYYRIPVSDRSGADAEMHAAYERGAANGADDAGVPLAVALPEPVPVDEAAAIGWDAAEEPEPIAYEVEPGPDEAKRGDTLPVAEADSTAIEHQSPETREMPDEAAEPPEEAEPTLAAWQEEQGISPEPSPEHANAEAEQGHEIAPAEAT